MLETFSDLFRLCKEKALILTRLSSWACAGFHRSQKTYHSQTWISRPSPSVSALVYCFLSVNYFSMRFESILFPMCSPQLRVVCSQVPSSLLARRTTTFRYSFQLHVLHSVITGVRNHRPLNHIFYANYKLTEVKYSSCSTVMDFKIETSSPLALPVACRHPVTIIVSDIYWICGEGTTHEMFFQKLSQLGCWWV